MKLGLTLIALSFGFSFWIQNVSAQDMQKLDAASFWNQFHQQTELQLDCQRTSICSAVMKLNPQLQAKFALNPFDQVVLSQLPAEIAAKITGSRDVSGLISPQPNNSIGVGEDGRVTGVDNVQTARNLIRERLLGSSQSGGPTATRKLHFLADGVELPEPADTWVASGSDSNAYENAGSGESGGEGPGLSGSGDVELPNPGNAETSELSVAIYIETNSGINSHVVIGGLEQVISKVNEVLVINKDTYENRESALNLLTDTLVSQIETEGTTQFNINLYVDGLVIEPLKDQDPNQAPIRQISPQIKTAIAAAVKENPLAFIPYRSARGGGVIRPEQYTDQDPTIGLAIKPLSSLSAEQIEQVQAGIYGTNRTQQQIIREEAPHVFSPEGGARCLRPGCIEGQ